MLNRKIHSKSPFSKAIFDITRGYAQVSYGINYDSSKSHWKPPLNTRIYATGISDDTWDLGMAMG